MFEGIQVVRSWADPGTVMNGPMVWMYVVLRSGAVMFVIRPAWLSLLRLGYFSLSDSGSVPILLAALQQCPK